MKNISIHVLFFFGVALCLSTFSVKSSWGEEPLPSCQCEDRDRIERRMLTAKAALQALERLRKSYQRQGGDEEKLPVMYSEAEMAKASGEMQYTIDHPNEPVATSSKTVPPRSSADTNGGDCSITINAANSCIKSILNVHEQVHQEACRKYHKEDILLPPWDGILPGRHADYKDSLTMVEFITEEMSAYLAEIKTMENHLWGRKFMGRCDAYWVGTLSVAFKMEDGRAETLFNRGGGNAKDIASNVHEFTRLEDMTEAILQPTTEGVKEQHRPVARVVHRFEYRYEYARSQNFSVTCRAPGQNTRWRETTAKNSEVMDERGESAVVEPIHVYTDGRTGSYEITGNSPAITTKWHREETNAPAGGCEDPMPNSTVSDGEGTSISEEYTKAGSFTIKGKVDPADPDTLSGREVKGNLKYGQFTTIWNLRLVKPESGK